MKSSERSKKSRGGGKVEKMSKTGGNGKITRVINDWPHP